MRRWRVGGGSLQAAAAVQASQSLALDHRLYDNVHHAPALERCRRGASECVLSISQVRLVHAR